MFLHNIAMVIAKIHAKNVMERQRIKNIWHSNDPPVTRNKPTTTKVIVAYLFIVLNTILIFAMVSMWHFQDLSALPVLITDIAAQVLTFVIYARKATAENVSKGNMDKHHDAVG